MVKRFFYYLFKSKIKPDIIITEYDLFENKIRLKNESIKVIYESIKEKSEKINSIKIIR
jgi:hypothetical protein